MRLGGRIAFGGDYNPEQWSEETWAEDVALMREAGVNLVTVGVFAWARLEPRPGEYDFGWLDRVLELLHENGVAVDLATATASPPPWLVKRHPEMLPVTAEGVRLGPGSRQHYCPSSPVYRDAAVRLASTIADRYGGHPALALWHVGNEYGVHTAECFCEVSAHDFRRWLRDRHGGLDELNAAWGTTFWSGRYGSFEEVEPPRRAPYAHNPAHVLDWRRFCSDAMVECFRLERDVLRDRTPDIPVTTNFLGVKPACDLWSWAAEEDVVSSDHYPDPADPRAPQAAALDADTMRSLRDGQPWLLMEQAAGAVDWRPRNQPKPPGVMRLGSLQAVARGSDSVLFFQWRAGRRGAEQFHSAMLPHGGRETRIFREVAAVGAELGRLGDLAGTRVEAHVALILDWDAWWALEAGPRPSLDLRVPELLRAYHRALWEANVAVDVRPPEAELGSYRLVVVPSLFAVSDAEAANLTEFAARGGHMVMGCFSGIVDLDRAVRLGGHPAAFRKLLGLRVDDFWPLAEHDDVALVDDAAATKGTGSVWSEWIEPEGAEALLRFASGDLARRPALLRHSYGAGTATYVATCPDPALLRDVMAEACAAANVPPVLPDAPAGVEAVRRGRALFLLNHGRDTVAIELPGPYRSLLDGATYDRALRLAARDADVLVEAA